MKQNRPDNDRQSSKGAAPGKKRKGLMGQMLIPTIVLGVIAVALIFIAYKKGDGSHVQGLKVGGTLGLQILPVIAFAVIIAGLLPLLIPQEQVSKWVGEESGLKGIFAASFIGGFAPGGPYVNFPIVFGMYKAGASIGVVVAFLTGWSLLAFARLPMELPLLGWRVTLIRFVSVMIFPPIAGVIAQYVLKPVMGKWIGLA